MREQNNLYYMRARYYSPAIKRFVNRDVLIGGVSKFGSLNRFGYVSGNSISFIDPYGKDGTLALNTFLRGMASAGATAISDTPYPGPMDVVAGGIVILTIGTAIYDWTQPSSQAETTNIPSYVIDTGNSCQVTDLETFTYYKKVKSKEHSLSISFVTPSSISDSNKKCNPRLGIPVISKNGMSKGYLHIDNSVWSKDKGSRHGGSAWKRWSSLQDFRKSKPREGTYDENCRRLRD